MNRNPRLPSLPTPERLRDLLDYEPETGLLRWRVKRNQLALAGTVAGTPLSNGYIKIAAAGRQLLAHRIAWAITYGAWPVADIDHINGNRADNRLANLREANRSQNQQNLRGPRNNSRSGYLGVHWHSQRKRWTAQITIGKRCSHLGLFDTPEEAHAAYLAAKARIHPFQTIAGQTWPFREREVKP